MRSTHHILLALALGLTACEAPAPVPVPEGQCKAEDEPSLNTQDTTATVGDAITVRFMLGNGPCPPTHVEGGALTCEGAGCVVTPLEDGKRFEVTATRAGEVTVTGTHPGGDGNKTKVIKLTFVAATPADDADPG